ncbi:sigma-70 family RNA polymerase sigma factor [Streptomyces sp. HD1123-B1]|uniref:sigma-70 family RNA polymerase sigma factor n=1 Tax=Streptomyces huangiella TaxID=3228804 RepID=UPI003D7DDD62
MQLTYFLPGLHRAALWTRLLRRARTAPDRRAGPPAAEADGVADKRRLRLLGPVRPGRDTGPRPTLDDLYRARRLDMVRLAVSLVDDRHTAEDVVQDAFAAVCRRHGARLDSLQDAHAYLHTAVINAARSVLRRRRTARAYTPPHHAQGAPVDERMLLAEEHGEVLDALARLTERQREVLVLRYWSELTEAQIAEALGVSRGTVKSTASRALDTLEKLLEADG